MRKPEIPELPDGTEQLRDKSEVRQARELSAPQRTSDASKAESDKEARGIRKALIWFRDSLKQLDEGLVNMEQTFNRNLRAAADLMIAELKAVRLALESMPVRRSSRDITLTVVKGAISVIESLYGAGKNFTMSVLALAKAGVRGLIADIDVALGNPEEAKRELQSAAEELKKAFNYLEQGAKNLFNLMLASAKTFTSLMKKYPFLKRKLLKHLMSSRGKTLLKTVLSGLELIDDLGIIDAASGAQDIYDGIWGLGVSRYLREKEIEMMERTQIRVREGEPEHIVSIKEKAKTAAVYIKRFVSYLDNTSAVAQIEKGTMDLLNGTVSMAEHVGGLLLDSTGGGAVAGIPIHIAAAAINKGASAVSSGIQIALDVASIFSLIGTVAADCLFDFATS